jgi:hypothetical protein
MLGVYELRQVDLLEDVFIGAMSAEIAATLRCARRLATPIHSALDTADVGAPRSCGRLDKKDAAAYVATWTAKNIETAEHERFAEIAETELPARRQLRALPDQTARIRGVAEGMERGRLSDPFKKVGVPFIKPTRTEPNSKQAPAAAAAL